MLEDEEEDDFLVISSLFKGDFWGEIEEITEEGVGLLGEVDFSMTVSVDEVVDPQELPKKSESLFAFHNLGTSSFFFFGTTLTGLKLKMFLRRPRAKRERERD